MSGRETKMKKRHKNRDWLLTPLDCTGVRMMATSLPEKSVALPTNMLPLAWRRLVLFACGWKGHLTTPSSNSVTLRFSICNDRRGECNVCCCHSRGKSSQVESRRRRHRHGTDHSPGAMSSLAGRRSSHTRTIGSHRSCGARAHSCDTSAPIGLSAGT